MTAYYNEIDPYAAQWLRNLIKEGLIADGEVDTRSIVDVRPRDLVAFKQCHFFAGLGGWSHALRLAGWPDDRPVWTGSCPCQPFSAAGDQRGFSDPRHLWPDWFRIIRQSCPSVVFGEQVASATFWIDRVCADMEAQGYAIGTAILPACSVNAPHKRDRLWFVAHADLLGASEGRVQWGGQFGWPGGYQEARALGHPAGIGGGSGLCEADTLENWNGVAGTSGAVVTGHDGKSRRVKPGVHLLAHGVPARVGKLRAYGNAIVPQVAAEFIRASMSCS